MAWKLCCGKSGNLPASLRAGEQANDWKACRSWSTYTNLKNSAPSAFHQKIAVQPHETTSVVMSESAEKSPSGQMMASSTPRPVVIGLYGVSGCGKTYLLKLLEEQLNETEGEQQYAFFDGSSIIDSVVEGGLEKFKTLSDGEKVKARERAIDKIAEECTHKKQTGIVAGHYGLWHDEEGAWKPVYTEQDWKTYTHVLYINVAAEIIARRRQDDKQRVRSRLSVEQLDKWQAAEEAELRIICPTRHILFFTFSGPTIVEKALALIKDFRLHNETVNLFRTERRLDQIVAAGKQQVETMLVLDADKTLTQKDTGALFWQHLFGETHDWKPENPLRKLFGGPLGHTYTAFRQATLLYEEVADNEDIDMICQVVASKVVMYPEMISLLQKVKDNSRLGAVVVTSGIRRVWDKVLEANGLSETVPVIGGGRIADGFVVTAAVKAALVQRLQKIHKKYAWAFGDSSLDLEMLKEADRGVVVVGEEATRSKSMDEALAKAIDEDGLWARQVLIPRTVLPRLTTMKLPIIEFNNQGLIKAVLHQRKRYNGDRVILATDKGAVKLLATRMRDQKVSGPALREAHRRAGMYLATEFLTDVIGLEDYTIQHVQDRPTTGFKLAHEDKTTIVALMRGGEPMALGVSETFPDAMFMHTKDPQDIGFKNHVEGQHNILLVDSVISTGKTILDFVHHIRRLDSQIRVVIVAGVVQADSISGGDLGELLVKDPNLILVGLRLSDTKFKGTKATDTGNRLFNTTHIE